MTTPTWITLSWPAQCDLAEADWSSGRELGGALLGHRDGAKIVVRQVSINPSGPQEENHTGFEWMHHLYAQRFNVHSASKPDEVFTEPELVIVGSIHSHPTTIGEARLSDGDKEHLAEMVAAWDGREMAGVVVTASGECWSEGFPDGLDYDPPVLTAWIASGGRVTPAIVTREPKWLWALRGQLMTQTGAMS